MYKRKCQNWLDSYLAYTAEQESPLEFHKWTGVAVLSAVLGRHVFLDRGYYTIYPNLYVLLVAGSAKCKKSTATNLGISLLKDLKSKPMIFSQKITTEALIQALEESKVDNQCSGIIHASELSVFMGADAQRSGLIPTLTDLYDSPASWSYRTRGRGLESLKNVTICMLAASTFEWLKSSIPESSIGGGFTSRIIFIYQEMPRKPILFPSKDSNFKSVRMGLIDDLNHIRGQRGQMELTPEALVFAKDWYARELYIKRDSKLEGYYGRKHDTMFKISMVLSMAESDNRYIELSHLQAALKLLDFNEESLYSITTKIASTVVGEATEKILNIIRKEGKIMHCDLVKKCWRYSNAMELSQHLQTLLEGQLIRSSLSKDNRIRYYEPTSQT